MDNLEEFLKDLGELTRKHGILISGCGCCGSPSLFETKDTGETFNYFVVRGEAELEWREPEKEKSDE